MVWRVAAAGSNSGYSEQVRGQGDSTNVDFVQKIRGASSKAEHGMQFLWSTTDDLSLKKAGNNGLDDEPLRSSGPVQPDQNDPAKYVYVEQTLQPTSYASWEELMQAHQTYLVAEPLLHQFQFYGSCSVNFTTYEHCKFKLSELDLAVAGVMRCVGAAVGRIAEGKTPKVLFAWGNRSFRSSCNLTSTHIVATTISQKARERDYLVLPAPSSPIAQPPPSASVPGLQTDA
ncbi:hypothetical protein EC968_005545 [Mortierella alpina]|nr:hypothetical protein EC968_005545 [Mortierella alpina]